MAKKMKQKKQLEKKKNSGPEQKFPKKKKK